MCSTLRSQLCEISLCSGDVIMLDSIHITVVGIGCTKLVWVQWGSHLLYFFRLLVRALHLLYSAANTSKFPAFSSLSALSSKARLQ